MHLVRNFRKTNSLSDENMWEFKRQLLALTTQVNMYTKKDDTFIYCVLVKVDCDEGLMPEIYEIYTSIELEK